MTLRQKTLLIFCITIFFLIATFYIAARFILLESFNKLEIESCRRNIERTLNIITYDVNYLKTTTNNYSEQDAAYKFIQDGNNNYVQSNLDNQSFAELGINVMLFINSSGDIVYKKGYSLSNNRKTPVPDDLLKQISVNNPLLYHPGAKHGLSGIVLLSQGPMLIASSPISATGGNGPVRGTLIVGRYLDSQKISQLGKITPYPVTMYRLDDIQLPPQMKSMLSSSSKTTPICIQQLNAKTMEGYALLKDIYGNPGLVLKVDMPRDIYQQGLTTMYYFLLALLLFGLVLTGMIMLLMERMVLARLAHLNNSVEKIGSSGDLSTRMPVAGKDELSNLASSVNRMLAALEHSHGKLRESEERYRYIVELSPDAVIVHREGSIIFINPAGVKLLAASTAQEVVGKPVLDFIHRDFRQTFVQHIAQMHKQGMSLSCEKFVRPDGTIIDAEVAAAGIIYGGRPAVQVVVRDITARKQMEDQLRYLSMHDVLTGQYNRAYFEEEIHRLEEKQHHPVSIIVCDVDGLKFVNDTFGHSAGDDLLRAAGNVIKKSFREKDVVTRIGGDEFTVLLPRCPKNVAQRAYRRLKVNINKYNADNPQLPLSLSAGIATSSEATVNLDEVFREADNNMYREKLLHRQSTRSAIVPTLMKALEARDFITEGHAERLQNLVVVLARALNLAEHKMTELRLLAQFHDIGKVGIPDRILFKPGHLSPEETSEMQKHCEIGHLIAQSSPDLAPIADLILKHHEWWNGMGYPLKLKGEEIPLACRILSIADAYDAMTNDRPYREAMTHEEAVAELLRCSQTQFDPALVPKFVRLINMGVLG